MKSPQDRDIGELAAAAARFDGRLAEVKRQIRAGFAWYPYHSLANFDHLERLLCGENRRLLRLIGDDPVLDVGAGDGDVAFFLESLGCRVHAVDHPIPNHNGMAGIRALKEALGSSVEIHAVDLDSQFALPEQQYGLVFFLGLLYHLKNPFYVLESLSKAARYCLLSTRVMRVLPPAGVSVQESPVAYLLDQTELNSDDTNFWIFSHQGLRRLLKRTNWEVLEFLLRGESEGSDPVSRDERAFCLLRSCYALKHCELLRGWHAPEGNGWRWTERTFSVAVPNAAGFSLRVFVPEILLSRSGALTISAQAGQERLPPEIYRASGEHTYARRLPKSGLIEFSVDPVLPPDDLDNRERGIIVSGLELN
jgi:tRNA (mo5U34)-methyltransferase